MADGENFRAPPGTVRDAILATFETLGPVLSVKEIEGGVQRHLGHVPPSSVRSFLALNTPSVFDRVGRGRYAVAGVGRRLSPTEFRSVEIGRATLVNADCLDWLAARADQSIHGVVTDPPYGLVEYNDDQLAKKKAGKGGVWRVPPAFDGSQRSPLPRFTVLGDEDIRELYGFFLRFGAALMPKLVPGANVLIASNPLLCHHVTAAMQAAGLEPRGLIVRQVMTMRGGDRPKNAHKEFGGVSVMPRSMWEPWVVLRVPLEGRVQDNLRKWSVGGFRRPSEERPFGDVIPSRPTSAAERSIAPHPSLKPQEFLRILARAVLPLGKGVILDPFAGSGSLLAACNRLGLESIGIEKNDDFFFLAQASIPKLTQV